MAKGGAFDIKENACVFGLFVLNQFKQDPGESERCIGGVSL